MRRDARLLIAGLLLTSLVAAPLSVPTRAAGAPVVVTIGRLFNDTMDTRLAAQRVSDALASVGYANNAYTSGRSAADAWLDGQRAAVLALFGHSNAGIFQTDEGPTDPEDEIVAAGTLGTVSLQTNTAGATDGALAAGASFGPAHWSFWKDYLPVGDVDDLLVAILAGCFTANPDTGFGDFLEVGRERGMDGVVGWTGLVFYPSGDCVDCNYSGNFFFDRFATYAQQGDAIATALAKAQADLLLKEGTAGGWNGWYIRGAAPSPADIRLAPASRGQPLNSKPFGIDPFQPLLLTVTASTPMTLDGVSLTDVQTAEGVFYRLDSGGRLLSLVAPSAATGISTLDESGALTRASAFASSQFGWIHPGELKLIAHGSASHFDGELRYSFIWRSMVTDVLGPTMLEIDVDAHTGAIVFAAASDRKIPASFAVSQDQAVASARQVARGALVDAHRELWDRPIWTVRFERPGGLVPDVTEVVVDGASGAILRQRKT